MATSPHAENARSPLSPGLDSDSVAWLDLLRADGSEHERALRRLHDLLLHVAFQEVNRRGPGTGISGPELDDLAHQATSDALVAIMAKLNSFRGESRFTTWACRFVILEVSSKLGRHYWRRPSVSLDAEEWQQLPTRLGVDPEHLAEQGELVTAVRDAVDHELTEHQRRLFLAIVVNGVPLDAMVEETGSTRGAIYKAISDARRKIRAFLVANEYLGAVLRGRDER